MGPDNPMPDFRPFLTKLKRYITAFLGTWVIVLVVLYLASGIYTVGPDQQGVVRRFGKYVRTVPSGLRYHLPYPFETVDTPNVTQVKRVEIGFRTVQPGPQPRYAVRPEEALMLTGDENIVNAEMIVQYRIKDARDYLFNVLDPDDAVRDAAEAALRQVIGSQPIDEALTTGKAEIQTDVYNLLQSLLDEYETGLTVVTVQLQDVHPPEAVAQAFKDVASAKEDKVKYINEAHAYYNEIIPEARGQAAEMILEAEAYRERLVARAEGEAARFTSLLNEYKLSPEVTRKRLYLETMESILPGWDKLLVTGEDSGILKVLDLGSGLRHNPEGSDGR